MQNSKQVYEYIQVEENMKLDKDIMAKIKLLTKSENVVHETYFYIVDRKSEYLILTQNTPYMNITDWLYNHHIQYLVYRTPKTF